MMLLLVGGSFLGFDQLITKIIDGLSERFAAQQVRYDRGRTLQPLLQEIALARKLARSQAIIEWAQDEENPKKGARGLAELESFRLIFKDGSYFFAIHQSGNYFFNDNNDAFAGRQLRYKLSPNQKKDAWYYATVKNPTECQLNVDNDSELGVTNIWINCLVKKDNLVIGVIGTGIELTKYIRAVLDAKQDGVVNMFIDSGGAIQAHPDIKKIDYHTLTKDAGSHKTLYGLLADDDSRRRLKAILEKLKAAPENIETTYLTISGQKTLVGIAYLKEIDWFNITAMTPSVWALGKGFVPLIGLMIVGMLLTLVFSAMVIHRIVLSRIYRLDGAVQKIRDNEHVLDLHDDSDDEIGRLTNSFFEMAGAVQKNRHVLEQQVAERTHELVEARDQAQAASRSKSEFLAMMSHDLRTPLNAIIGFSEMIQYETFGPVGDERYKTYLQDINDSGQLLLSLINILLDISKIEAGKLELTETEVDPLVFLQKLVRLIKPQSQERNISLNIINGGNVPGLMCDQRSLSQIVNNLLSNAIKFSDQGQSVNIYIEANKNEGYVIRVEDFGIGMDAHGIEKALDPFLKADANEARNMDGTGLGLHVSKLLMSEHDGELAIASVLGKGSSVTITFPPTRIVSN